MLAATVTGASEHDPLSMLRVGEHPEPEAGEGWSVVEVRAASINHHDVWTLRGVAPKGAPLPRVLGSDASGVDGAGREVVVHAMLDGGRMLSDWDDGTLAERVAVPAANLVPKPAGLSFEEAACLPTAWLTAYRMLFTLGGATAGTVVLVQGAGGGVATAATMLGAAAGVRVFVTSRSEEKRARAVELGAAAAFEPGARLPERADVVLETVGAATWEHSLKAVRPGGTIVVAGKTSGNHPPLDLERVYLAQLRILGTTMGTREELAALAGFCVEHRLHPPIHATLPLTEVREGFREMIDRELFGKIVLRP
jgi:NADPH:quinone reductase-like Zn-dependent oxidoreductase